MRSYEPSDYEQVMGWWMKRGKEAIPSEYFPSIGFIEDGKAAVFLYTTNSAIAYLDLLVANPEADADAALDSVVNACIEDATKRGFKLLLSTTSRDYVTSRALKHGFVAEPGYTQLARKL